MTTWNEILGSVATNDTIIAKAPADEAVWEYEFHDGFGIAAGPDVLAWSATLVYFPVVYDGSEWLATAPRDPQNLGQPHVGGQ